MERLASPSSSVALVVFDLAGTTIEDENVVARCLVEAAAAVGATIGIEDANAVMGLPKPDALARLLTGAGEAPELGPDSERVVRATKAFERAILRHYDSPGAVVPIAGVEKTFADLHEHGARIAINTGFSAAVADAILHRLGWIASGLVDMRVTSDEVPKGRPAPDMIYEAMRRSSVVDVSSVAKVGDTPADLMEGSNAGCGWVVGVTYGTHSREQLSRFPHTALIDDVQDLTAVLGIAVQSGLFPRLETSAHFTHGSVAESGSP